MQKSKYIDVCYFCKRTSPVQHSKMLDVDYCNKCAACKEKEDLEMHVFRKQNAHTLMNQNLNLIEKLATGNTAVSFNSKETNEWLNYLISSIYQYLTMEDKLYFSQKCVSLGLKDPDIRKSN